MAHSTEGRSQALRVRTLSGCLGLHPALEALGGPIPCSWGADRIRFLWDSLLLCPCQSHSQLPGGPENLGPWSLPPASADYLDLPGWLLGYLSDLSYHCDLCYFCDLLLPLWYQTVLGWGLCRAPQQGQGRAPKTLSYSNSDLAVETEKAAWRTGEATLKGTASAPRVGAASGWGAGQGGRAGKGPQVG